MRSSADSAGVRFGKYAIRKRLAKGGMGEVFLADQLGPQGPVRPVALKRILPRLAKEDDVLTMFLDEMSTAARLNHPNIATTYDFGEVEGVHFIAMEYVEGLSLKHIADALGPLPAPMVLSVALQVLSALSHAHAQTAIDGRKQPVVHRDVSPHNILVSTRGEVKLLDFGIAKTEAQVLGGLVQGKVAYAAPEQLAGEDPERQSDLWALGVVMYELLVGSKPFELGDPVLILEAAQRGQFRSVSELRPDALPLAKVIERALCCSLDERWTSANDMSEALRSVSMELDGASAAALSDLVSQSGGPLTTKTGVEPISSFELPAVRNPPTVTLPVISTSQIRQVQRAKEEPATASRWRATTTLGASLLVAALAIFAIVMPDTEPEIISKPIAKPVSPAPAQPKPSPAPVEEPVVAKDPVPEETPAPPIVAAPPEPAPKKKPRRSRPKRTAKPKPAPVVEERHGKSLLFVRTIPWAKISIDGKPVGTSPIARFEIESGTHTLQAKPGQGDFGPIEKKFVVAPGEAARIVIDFRKSE